MDLFNNIDQSNSPYKPNWYIFTIIFKKGGGVLLDRRALSNWKWLSVIFDSHLSNEMVKNDDW